MNNKIANDQLDPYWLPLYGQRLIEASAGTGKTHTIALLYLRLLLGIRKKNTYTRPLQVKEILVVTFTKLATNELRSRIQYNIHQMRIACIRDGINLNKNSIYKILLASITNKNMAAQLLLNAERQMDEAAIYTIHSFCQHILVNNAFESRMPFKQSITKDEHIIYQQVCADFWRRNFYPLDYSISKIIADEWRDPEDLLAEIKPCLQGDIPIFINQSIKTQSIKKHHQTLIKKIKTFKNLWLINFKNFLDLIINSDINKRIYNSHNIPIWLGAISNWAQEKTIDYKIPKELIRFSQSELSNKTLTNNAPKHKVFLVIDNLLKQSFTLRNLIISKAIINIRKTIIKEKKQHGKIGFDDLLSYLDNALHTKFGNKLAKKIRNQYPVVMIDEFQDTDPKQYRIFQRIYQANNNCCLLFIGDPKQSIYAFRGADIFTYLKAKEHIKSQYTLNTNWRSSPSMVAAINQLFSRVKNPFIFKQIPFNVVKSAYVNKNLAFFHENKKIAALNFYYINKRNISIFDYNQTLAYQCANKVCEWLKGSENSTSWLYINKIKKPITTDDIMILVRTHNEAMMIQKALHEFNISSIFLSNQNSVFATNEARDLLWLLKAVLSPAKESILRCALATKLIGLNAQEIEQLNQDENQWAIRVEEFTNYLFIWQQHGITPTLKTIMVNNKIAENLLMNNIEGEKRLMHIMHLSELLQEAELQLDSMHALINWLAKQIDKPDPLSETHKIRLESNKYLIRISTIHKAKGLEFPIVYIPFACKLHRPKLITFHDRNNFQLYLDLTKQKKHIRLANEERLSEDLRLLYVALTRAKYHCSVGMYHLINDNTNTQTDDVELHLTALDYLLQNNQKLNNKNAFLNDIELFSSKNISIIPINNINVSPWYPKENKPIKLLARNFTGKIQNNWRITSYSGLIYNDKTYSSSTNFSNSDKNIEIDIKSLFPKINTYPKDNNLLLQDEIINRSIHTFPRGNKAGIFLHSLFELLPFNKHHQESWLAKKLEQAGFSINWAPTLKICLINISETPLLKNNLRLSKIMPKFQLTEMKFYLPIKKILFPSILNRIAHYYDKLSNRCPQLNFQPVIGILKGYIDLVFCWQERFYLLDYKSNWLGENSLAYDQNAIERTMIDHRYDLQYQLYTLALHRYLRNRLPGYHYQKHFGGIIYLFLRGIDINNPPGYGIYHTIPAYELINAMDKLFNTTNNDKE